MDINLIDGSEAYKLLKHEEETHMLPASKEAYARAGHIVASMKTQHVVKEAPMLEMSTVEKVAITSMPIFSCKCGNCDAMIFEDDKFCSQCGVHLNKKTEKQED